jgi:hypothetical protein
MPCKTTVHTYCISDTLTTMIRPSVCRSQAPLTRTSILQHIRSFAQLTYRIRCICIAHVNPLSLPLPPNRANHSAAHHLPLNHALTNSIPADRSTRRCTCRHLSASPTSGESPPFQSPFLLSVHLPRIPARSAGTLAHERFL